MTDFSSSPWKQMFCARGAPRIANRHFQGCLYTAYIPHRSEHILTEVVPLTVPKAANSSIGLAIAGFNLLSFQTCRGL